jgi:hypothetical protein
MCGDVKVKMRANRKFEVQLLQMELRRAVRQRVAAGTAWWASGYRLSHVCEITLSKSDTDGLNKISGLAEAYAERKPPKNHIVQHDFNPTNPIDHPVMGGSVRPPSTSRPETGKPIADPNNRESEQAQVSRWNKLP